MLWDYSYAPDKPVYWPKDWPDLTSKRAVKRNDMWSIFLDGSYLPRLEAFLENAKGKGRGRGRS